MSRQRSSIRLVVAFRYSVFLYFFLFLPSTAGLQE